MMAVRLDTPILELHRHAIAHSFGVICRKSLHWRSRRLQTKYPADATVEDLRNYFPMRYEIGRTFCRSTSFDGIELPSNFYGVSGATALASTRNRDSRSRPSTFSKSRAPTVSVTQKPSLSSGSSRGTVRRSHRVITQTIRSRDALRRFRQMGMGLSPKDLRAQTRQPTNSRPACRRHDLVIELPVVTGGGEASWLTTDRRLRKPRRGSPSLPRRFQCRPRRRSRKSGI